MYDDNLIIRELLHSTSTFVAQFVRTHHFAPAPVQSHHSKFENKYIERHVKTTKKQFFPVQIFI